MSTAADSREVDQPDLKRTLTTAKIVALILASVAPLTVVVSVFPLGFGFGGPGFTVMYLVAGAILLAFSVGYAEMGARLRRIDGVWSYVRESLGAVPAGGAAWLALAGYFVVLIGAVGSTSFTYGYVASTELGIDLPWFWYALILMVPVSVLASREIDLSAKVVGILVAFEFALIVVLDLLIVADKGVDALPSGAFSADAIGATALGVGLLYAIISFLAFESAALYGNEAKDPQRSVPRATLISVALIAVFYVAASWISVGGFGLDVVQKKAATEGGALLFSQASEFGGAFADHAMSALMVTSLFATTLGLTNITARYTFVLANERLLPTWFGKAHARWHAPTRAALSVAGGAVLIVAVVGLLGADPYLDISGVAFGLGAVCIVGAWCLTAVAVIVYFRRVGATSVLRHQVLPVVGLGGLLVALYLMTTSLSAVTGKVGGFYDWLPALALLALVAGVARALQLRRSGGDAAVATTAEVEATARDGAHD